MAFIEIKVPIDKKRIETITINTGYIFKVYRSKENLGHSLIAYDYLLEVIDEVSEPYTELVKRIIEAEEGEIEEGEENADSSTV